MLRRCSHCSFALLIVFFIERDYRTNATIGANGSEDFRRWVDTEHKTGEPPCDCCHCRPCPQRPRRFGLHPLVDEPSFEQCLQRLRSRQLRAGDARTVQGRTCQPCPPVRVAGSVDDARPVPGAAEVVHRRGADLPVHHRFVPEQRIRLPRPRTSGNLAEPGPLPDTQRRCGGAADTLLTVLSYKIWPSVQAPL